ncbi:MAG: hypothetical protein RBT60_14440 [Candidatus Krumholzibacteria bacterium]|jgi:hypothetical protein|nr:hypothetical protein [Candidatus Krumholzibacteria bacterium]
MNTRPIRLAAAALAALAALAPVVLPVAGTAAAAVFDNPLDPPQGRRTLALRELWRAGGESDDVFFGNVGGVLAGPDGEVLVLDSQLAQVQVYDAQGRWLRSLSREGEGPGEVRNPAACFFLPDGRLCLAQSFPGRLVYLQPDGTPAGQAQYEPLGTPASFSVMVSGRTAPGGMVLAGIRMNQGATPQMQQTFFLSLCDTDAKEKQVYLEKPYTVNFAEFRLDEGAMDFVWMGRLDVDAQGRVATAPERNRYLVRVQDSDGTVLREFTRPVTLPKRTAAERTIATKVLEAIAVNYGGLPLQGLTIEETEAAINGLVLRPDGEVWVMTPYNKTEPGVFAVLDVFDAAGRFTHQVALQMPGNAQRDGLNFLADGRVVVVAGGLDAWLSQQGVQAADQEAVALEIICYEAAR